jgi:hypothetical protein
MSIRNRLAQILEKARAHLSRPRRRAVYTPAVWVSDRAEVN